MGGIIVAMPRTEDAERIASMLSQAGIEDNVFSVKTGARVLAALGDHDADLVICTSRLNDMSFEEIVEYMPSYANLILLTKDPSVYSTSSNVMRLLMPFRTGDLINTISMLRGPVRIKKKKPVVVRTEEEQEVIDRAKQILMTRNDMSEADAFRYIQKRRMDSGRTMVESAGMILLLNSE